MFKHYKNKIENQHDKKINVIRNGRDEVNNACNEFCFQNNIIHQITTPYPSK